ncbi:MAG: AEC family transporter [Actinobacteria bacterium]|nr:AEC family transporter [Actinomycetota bacterium]MCL5887073.1 AEC family transporter [Actinomycetota bacterium]
MDALGTAGITLGFIGMVAFGWLLRWTGLLSADDAKPLNVLIVYIGLPALVFRSIQTATLERDMVLIAVSAWVVFGVTALVAWGAARLMALSRPVAGGFILTSALGNTAYLGYPMALALFGEEGLSRAIFYDIFGTVGAMLLVGLLIAERFGRSDGRPIRPAREILTFPAVIAVVIALLLQGIEIPVLVSDWLDTFAKLVTPLIMISVGLTLSMGSLREHIRPLMVLSGIRLALAPAAAFIVGSMVLEGAGALDLLVLSAGMPSMMLTLVIGSRFGLDTGFIAAAILMTTTFSVVTIPVMRLLMG